MSAFVHALPAERQVAVQRAGLGGGDERPVRGRRPGGGHCISYHGYDPTAALFLRSRCIVAAAVKSRR